MMINAEELQRRMNCSRAVIGHWTKQGLPCERKKKGSGWTYLFDPEAVSKWCHDTGKKLFTVDENVHAPAPEKKPKKKRRTKKSAAITQLEAFKIEDLLAANTDRDTAAPLSKRAAQMVLNIFKRMEVAELAEYSIYADLMQDVEQRAAASRARKSWMDTAKLAAEIAELLPAAQVAVGAMVERRDVEANNAKIGNVLQRTLMAIPNNVSNTVRHLMLDQSAAAEVARLIHDEISIVLEDISKKLSGDDAE